jgi:hypothetical protein
MTDDWNSGRLSRAMPKMPLIRQERIYERLNQMIFDCREPACDLMY